MTFSTKHERCKHHFNLTTLHQCRLWPTLFTNKLEIYFRSRDRDRDLDNMNSSALESRDHSLEIKTLIFLFVCFCYYLCWYRPIFSLTSFQVVAEYVVLITFIPFLFLLFVLFLLSCMHVLRLWACYWINEWMNVERIAQKPYSADFTKFGGKVEREPRKSIRFRL